ncbi:MAG: 2-aminoethylphosphonate--pyruvate transaminase [Bacteroidales bacterium]|nr:2-aminoethylphosphonate--pyruvate transaminase [Bacteroidales bacterium]
MIISDFKRTKDKLLFTPGPLTTSTTVKEAALIDLGSRDSAFIAIVQQIRQKLLALAHVESPNYEAVIIQGSGTFGIESTITSAIPASGMLLNIVNGAYGRRMSQIARIHHIPLIELMYDENQLPDLTVIETLITENPEITHIAVVHGETTTGLLNPIEEIGEIAHRLKKTFIVDAMSTFGAYDIDMRALKISYLISSSNKCIEGIPGFSYVLAKRIELEKCKKNVRSLSLDLYDQWSGLNTNGQFRFTPPVHALLAFNEALIELENEGGIEARAQRYADNNALLIGGMEKLGFTLYLSPDVRSYIITSFLYPGHPDFSFEVFYSKLNDMGFVIYPGKLSKVDCFRIGNIGQLYPVDIQNLIDAVEKVIHEMNIVFTEQKKQ